MGLKSETHGELIKLLKNVSPPYLHNGPLLGHEAST